MALTPLQAALVQYAALGHSYKYVATSWAFRSRGAAHLGRALRDVAPYRPVVAYLSVHPRLSLLTSLKLTILATDGRTVREVAYDATLQRLHNAEGEFSWLITLRLDPIPELCAPPRAPPRAAPPRRSILTTQPVPMPGGEFQPWQSSSGL
ncbi:MAG TPA: hypothetical protein VIJ22_09340 [Polyangiaceae bacterium]